MNTRAKAALPSSAPFPASSSPAASTTSSRCIPRRRRTTLSLPQDRRQLDPRPRRLLPARLTGYGETWQGDECTLWCEGIVQQSTVFGEDLHLIRRIEAKVGGNEFVLRDRVVNHGFYRTPHMLLYHINLGHPVLAEGSRYLAPITADVWASHAGDNYRRQGVGYRTISAPQQNFHEQVWQHELAGDEAGEAPVAVVNDALGLGFEVVTRKEQFPCMYEWQNLQAGQYALGIEPSTNHVLGHMAARERGELIWLEHGEEPAL